MNENIFNKMYEELLLKEIESFLGYIPEGDDFNEVICNGIYLINERQEKEIEFDNNICLELNIENPFNYDYTDDNYFNFIKDTS